jgi:hypothetical protein
MSDQPQPSPAISSLAADAADDVLIVKNALAAYRAKGTQGLIASMPGIVTAVEKDIADVRAALPEIKAGYKTTEFWLCASLPLLNGLYLAITGKTLPFDLNAILAAVAALYTVVRGLMKK